MCIRDSPGCFALTAQLSLLPFQSMIKKVSITAITGSSGGGKNPSNKNHHSTRSKDIFSYNINSHRHLAEIYQSFPNLKETLSFVPLSGPFSRGIYLTSHIETFEDVTHELHLQMFLCDLLDIYLWRKVPTVEQMIESPLNSEKIDKFLLNVDVNLYYMKKYL